MLSRALFPILLLVVFPCCVLFFLDLCFGNFLSEVCDVGLCCEIRCRRGMATPGECSVVLVSVVIVAVALDF